MCLPRVLQGLSVVRSLSAMASKRKKAQPPQPEHHLARARFLAEIKMLEMEALKDEGQGELKSALKIPFHLHQSLEEVKNVLASLEVRCRA